MFKEPPLTATTALLVAVGIVLVAGCSASPTGVTTTSTEHLSELAQPDTSEFPTSAQETAPTRKSVAGGIGLDGGSADTATTMPGMSTLGGGTALEQREDAEDAGDAATDVDLTAVAGAELDLPDLEPLLADLDGLLGDIDGEINDLDHSFDNDEGDVEE